MKKALDDLKSFTTVAVILLFGYCIVRQIPIPEELKAITLTVVSFFLGSKVNKEENNNGSNE